MQCKTVLNFVVFPPPKGSISANNGKNAYEVSKYRYDITVNFLTSLYVSVLYKFTNQN